MRIKEHPLGEQVATAEGERVLARFDGIYSMHRAEMVQAGAGAVLYTPERTPEAAFLPAANLKGGPPNLVEIVWELIQAVPDANHVPVIFAYKNGGIVTYILTAGYTAAGIVHPVIVRKEYHTLAGPKRQVSTPGDVKPWEIDL